MHVLIILGQCLNNDGSVPDILKARVTGGADVHAKLTKEGKECCVIVTGGDTSRVGRTEAAVMEELLGRGVRVVKEEKARNTLENAYYCGAIIESLKGNGDKDVEAVHLITSAFHLPRSLLAFYSVLPQYRPIMVPVATPSACPYLPQDHSVCAINANIESTRVAHELNTVKNRLPRQFEHHVKGGAFKPLLPSKLDVAAAVKMLEEQLRNCHLREAPLSQQDTHKYGDKLAGKQVVLVSTHDLSLPVESLKDSLQGTVDFSQFDIVEIREAPALHWLGSLKERRILIFTRPQVIKVLTGADVEHLKAVLLTAARL
eukprot:TRINITY_DN3972_c0_g3_i1.p1 TRINITY_DN3972_c0_g3~~TRINITY_DN3972_c0_g3_i1.p1  ORF type:complete len:330 (+),score=89.70 TRINITY_DN3972_c0_g3_i1:45-992(+)